MHVCMHACNKQVKKTAQLSSQLSSQLSAGPAAAIVAAGAAELSGEIPHTNSCMCSSFGATADVAVVVVVSSILFFFFFSSRCLFFLLYQFLHCRSHSFFFFSIGHVKRHILQSVSQLVVQPLGRTDSSAS